MSSIKRISKGEARIIALRLAYQAVEKAVQIGGEEMGEDADSQIEIDKALDAISQQLYERWQRAKERKESR